MPTLADIDPRDSDAQALTHFVVAVSYIEQHQACHLDEDQLLVACASVLAADHGVMDTRQGHAIAVAALAEVQARTRPAWIDIDRSTARVCRVVDPVTSQVATFTASELVSLAQERAVLRSTVPPEAQASRRARKLN